MKDLEFFMVKNKVDLEVSGVIHTYNMFKAQFRDRNDNLRTYTSERFPVDAPESHVREIAQKFRAKVLEDQKCLS